MSTRSGSRTPTLLPPLSPNPSKQQTQQAPISYRRQTPTMEPSVLHALFHAVFEGDRNTVLRSVNPQNVAASNSNGTTMLHIAAENAREEIIPFLVSRGANPNAQTLNQVGGSTPLHLAAKKNHISTCLLLLRNGADPNIVDAQGFTSLICASRLGYGEVGAVLLANVSSNEHVEFNMCTNSGADPEIKDKHGKTASYWARESNCHMLLQALPPPKFDWLEMVGPIPPGFGQPPKKVKKTSKGKKGKK